MNKTKLAAISLCLSTLSVCMPLSAYAQTNVNEYGTSWRWNGGTIEVESPERGEGQKSVLGLALAPMESVRIGFVGLGMRGPGAVERFTYIPGVEIKALCDYDPARAEGCQKYLKEASMRSHRQMRFGERQECGHRGAFRHESERLLGTRGSQREDAETLYDT